MIAPKTSHVVGPVLLRLGFATVVSATVTGASLATVASLNAEAPQPEPTLPSRPLAVPIATAPETRTPEPTPQQPTPLQTAASTSPTPSKPRAAPLAAPNLGIMPTAGPGTLALGNSGALPSVADLPHDALPTVTATDPDVAARPLARPSPKYPPLALRRKIEGSVTVRMRVDESGRVVNAVIVSSEPSGVFDQTALRTARRYRFSPARVGGHPSATTVEQTIRFRLP